MNWKMPAAIALIVLGVVVLAYGKFSYTKERHDAKLGSLSFSLKEKQTVNVPAWLGIGAIGAGTVLLIVGRKK